MRLKKIIIISSLMALKFFSSCAEDQLTEKPFIDNDNLDQLGNVDNPYWEWIGIFPGWVDNLDQREQIVCNINGDFKTIAKDSRMNYKLSPWISTGVYAAPGEVLKLVAPKSIQHKVQWRIGAWNCILPSSATLKRFNKIYETGSVNSDTTYIMNYFGGNVYIVPNEPFESNVNVEIIGGVKSPDFILGQTDVATWQEAVKNSSVPFAELRGKRTIWTMSKEQLKKITQPDKLLALYDEIIEKDFNQLHGLEDNPVDPIDQAPTFPLRFVQDIQMCGSDATHSGYPIVLDISDAEIGIDYDNMRMKSTAWNFYKEVGRIYQNWCWKWVDGPGSVDEVTNMIPYYYSKARILGRWPLNLSDADKVRSVYEWEYIVKDFVLKNDTSKDFDMGNSGFGVAINRYNGRMIPYVQLAQQYGWKIITYLSKYSRHNLDNDAVNVLKILKAQARKDYFCKRVSEYAGVNLIPFFDAWGIKYSVNAEADMNTLPDFQGDRFWEKWNESNVGDFIIERTVEKRLPDNNYNIESIWDQTQWSVIGASDIQYESNAEPEKTIDGKMSKGNYCCMDYISAHKRPVLAPQLWIEYDMKNVGEITGGGIHYRSDNDYSHLHPETFSIEIKEELEDEWQMLGYFRPLITYYSKANQIWHNFRVETPKKGRFVRLTALRGFKRSKATWPNPWPDNIGAPSQETGGIGIGEFRLSGKMQINNDSESGVDQDFPDWDVVD